LLPHGIDACRSALTGDEGAAAQRAERAQLVEELRGEGATTFGFVHSLIAATLVEGMPALHRRQERVAARLREEGLFAYVIEDFEGLNDGGAASLPAQ
jgi:hypothetical protein